jgi:isoleucyl-tRNA synthetase
MNYLIKLSEVVQCDKCYTILNGEYVTTEDGTGIVHTAPGFGEDDNMVCKNVGIPTICPVDDAGCFTAIIKDYEGKQVFETNDPIILRLKENGILLKTEQIVHNYPHCWRTDTPLIYRAISSWYVKVTDIKESLIKNNQNINWIPEHVKNGRFGKWLEGARDWAITRNRFWGCPVPVWKSTDPQYPRIDVYGSIAELEKDFGVKVDDLHRPFIDKLTRKNPNDPTGKSMMERVPDVLDCWFESGAMPYAQLHYPFENSDYFKNNFPADFITEGDGQIRGWFYTLLVLSCALFDKNPFKTCISFGTIVDEEGKKLSKRWRNYVDPQEAFDTFGSDAIRWLMLKSPALKGEEFRIDKHGKDMRETLRLSIKPILNSYNFFCLYANSDGIEAEFKLTSQNVMDKYILSKLKNTIDSIKNRMDKYEIGDACRISEDFFEILNNWYIRRNKNRFWKSEKDNDKMDAYNTLYVVLLTMCKAIASLMPFTTEYIWRGLNKK